MSDGGSGRGFSTGEEGGLQVQSSDAEWTGGTGDGGGESSDELTEEGGGDQRRSPSSGEFAGCNRGVEVSRVRLARIDRGRRPATENHERITSTEPNVIAIEVEVEPLPTSFESWDVFGQAVEEYCAHTFQLYRIRTTSSVEKRNAALRQNLLPAELEYYSKTLICTHGFARASRSKGLRKNQSVRGTGCRAKINAHAKLDIRSGQFMIKVSQSCIHNHSVGPRTFANYAENRRCEDPDLLQVVDELQRAGAKKKRILEYLRAKTGKRLLIRDVHNLVRRMKVQRRGDSSLEQRVEDVLRLFVDCNDDRGNVARVYVDTDNVAQTITIQTAEQRRLFQRFPEVLLIDATHGTNNSRYKLFSFMVHDAFGHGQYIQHALIENESADNLTDAVKAFKLHNSMWEKVRVIVIDKGSSELSVLPKLFPLCTVLLCQFHVIKYIKTEIANAEKYPGITSHEKQRVVDLIWLMIRARSANQFTKHYNAMLHTLKNDKNDPFVQYFDANWGECKQQWCSYLRGNVPHLNNNTNNRFVIVIGIKSRTTFQAAHYRDSYRLRIADGELNRLSNLISRHAWEAVLPEYKYAIANDTEYTIDELTEDEVEICGKSEDSQTYVIDVEDSIVNRHRNAMTGESKYHLARRSATTIVDVMASNGERKFKAMLTALQIFEKMVISGEVPHVGSAVVELGADGWLGGIQLGSELGDTGFTQDSLLGEHNTTNRATTTLIGATGTQSIAEVVENAGNGILNGSDVTLCVENESDSEMIVVLDGYAHDEENESQPTEVQRLLQQPSQNMDEDRSISLVQNDIMPSSDKHSSGNGPLGDDSDTFVNRAPRFVISTASKSSYSRLRKVEVLTAPAKREISTVNLTSRRKIVENPAHVFDKRGLQSMIDKHQSAVRRLEKAGKSSEVNALAIRVAHFGVYKATDLSAMRAWHEAMEVLQQLSDTLLWIEVSNFSRLVLPVTWEGMQSLPKDPKTLRVVKKLDLAGHLQLPFRPAGVDATTELLLFRRSEWLNDTCILAALHTLNADIQRAGIMEPAIFSHGTRDEQRVIIEERNIMNCMSKVVIAVVNVGNCHWCVIYMNFNTGFATAFDPQQEERHYEVLQEIYRDVLMPIHGQDLVLGRLSTIRQQDVSSCGLYVLVVCEALVRDVDFPPLTPAFIQYYRYRYLMTILRQM
ncbi:hypothetical protein BBJ28_00014636 [Nothophytophthora sp. Chile5]|nr:hypothetical protein BBJ28_00014636 [Nothophytophthora sp. Chile5]